MTEQLKHTLGGGVHGVPNNIWLNVIEGVCERV